MWSSRVVSAKRWVRVTWTNYFDPYPLGQSATGLNLFPHHNDNEFENCTEVLTPQTEAKGFWEDPQGRTRIYSTLRNRDLRFDHHDERAVRCRREAVKQNAEEKS